LLISALIQVCTPDFLDSLSINRDGLRCLAQQGQICITKEIFSTNPVECFFSVAKSHLHLPTPFQFALLWPKITHEFFKKQSQTTVFSYFTRRLTYYEAPSKTSREAEETVLPLRKPERKLQMYLTPIQKKKHRTAGHSP
jgi:hypothetical protein